MNAERLAEIREALAAGLRTSDEDRALAILTAWAAVYGNALLDALEAAEAVNASLLAACEMVAREFLVFYRANPADFRWGHELATLERAIAKERTQ